MVRKLGLIIRRDLLATLRRPFYLVFTIGVPLLMAIIAAVVYQLNSQPTIAPNIEAPVVTESILLSSQIGLVDNSGLLQIELIEKIPDLLLYSDVEDALEAFNQGEIAGYYVIPGNFLDTGALDYYLSSPNPLTTQADSFLLQRLLVAGMLKNEPGTLRLALDPITLKTVALEAANGAKNGAENWYASNLSMFMVILLYMVILLPASNLVSSLTDEKKNQVMEVLLCTVSPMQLFVGKLIATGLLGLLQTTLWVGILWGVGSFGGQPLGLPEGYEVPKDILAWGIVFATLGYLMYGAQLGGVGAIAPNIGETRSVTMLVLSPLIIGYIFSVLPETSNTILSNVFSYFPLTAPVAMISRMAGHPLPWWEPFLSAALQVGMVILLVRLFGRLFHARLMLSGQPLTVRRLFKALSEQ